MDLQFGRLETSRSAGQLERHMVAAVATAAAIWGAFAVLFWQMYGSRVPHGAGFDFEILLTGAQRAASGQPPYDPSLLAGQATAITEEFYTYPPLVAQALVPVASLPPLAVIIPFLAIAALAGAAVLGLILARGGIPLRAGAAASAALVLLPFWFPFTLAMLFANFDALFVALYGLVVLAAVERVPSRRTVLTAGIALALAALTKLHPAVLGVWLLARGWRERTRGEHGVVAAGRTVPASWMVAAAAVTAALVVLLLSVLVGGIEPWRDYLTMLRSSTGVGLLDPRNLAPVPQFALRMGLGASAVGPGQSAMVVLALATTIAAALTVDDPLTSILWAITASLVVLPVTWFHHLAVLAPILAAALARSWVIGGTVVGWTAAAVLAALLVGVAGFGTVVAWLTVAVAFAAVRISANRGSSSVAAPPVSTGA